MQDQPKDDLYRIPCDQSENLENMPAEEIELRNLLSAFTRDPDDPNTLIQIARLLMSKSLYEEAGIYFDRYLEKIPEDAEALNCAGVVRFVRGDLTEAEAFFEHALNLDGTLADALYNSAMIHMEKGDFSRARERFQTLARLDGENPEVFNNLGALCYQSGDLDESESHFRKSLSLDPNHCAALRNLMEVLLDKGQVDEARTFLQPFQRTEPEPEEIAALQKRFAETEPVPFIQTPRTADPIPVPAPARAAAPSPSQSIAGLTIGIVSDWCPGDRGDLAMWIRSCLGQAGHRPHLLARTGTVPHCEEQNRSTPPCYMGSWAVPDLTPSLEPVIAPAMLKTWLEETHPDVVVFIDENDPGLVQQVRDAGAAIISCPTLTGMKPDAFDRFTAFDAVLAPSPWIYEQLKSRIPIEKLRLAEMGIDLRQTAPVHQTEGETLFLVDAGHGSVEELKNLLLFLSAFNLMNREAQASARALIRTEVDWNLFPEEIRRLGEGNSAIDLCRGPLEDSRFFGMGNILVHLRRSPGLHWIVAKAAACGLPAIVADQSPANSWIYDPHMILKVPLSPETNGESEQERLVDLKTLADVMTTLTKDTEMCNYMRDLCREKTGLFLDTLERGPALCDHLVTAAAGRQESPTAQDQSEPAPTTDELLKSIEDALHQGNAEDAKELLAKYRSP